MSAALVIAVAGTQIGQGDSRPTGRTPEKTLRPIDAKLSGGAEGSKACPSARKAVKFYSRRIAEHRAQMGAGGTGEAARPLTVSRREPCPRYLAHVLQRKARVWRLRARAWRAYHYHWWKWLPSKWQRIGACETGYGRRPGQWTWNSGTYQGAFGFYYGTWDQYKPAGAPSEAYLATPRQQYQCALNVYAAHGYGAWGCGGA